jgi:signal peptidase I
MRKTRALVTAVVLLATAAAGVATVQVVTVDGDSMMPTLHNGQFVLAVRRAGRPRVGDIVLIRRDRDILVKRVAYLPSQQVAPLDLPLFARCSDYFEAGRRPHSLRVPAGRVVVMGDNRANSDDSRRFGPVRMADVVGRVIAVSPFP